GEDEEHDRALAAENFLYPRQVEGIEGGQHERETVPHPVTGGAHFGGEPYGEVGGDRAVGAHGDHLENRGQDERPGELPGGDGRPPQEGAGERGGPAPTHEEGAPSGDRRQVPGQGHHERLGDRGDPDDDGDVGGTER